MTSLIDLLKDDDIRELCDRETILAGHELWKQGEVTFGAFKPELIEATVLDGGKQYKTSFQATNEDLNWACTCGIGSFCKHLVVTALDAQREGRGDIYKAAGIIIKDRKMLVERSVGKPAYIGPGGRLMDGESAAQALVRELEEELQIIVEEKELEPFGTFSAEAANHPGQQVHMDAFLVKSWSGDIKPNNEVESILWLGSELPKGVEIGSIFAHDILPRLKEQKLVD